MSSENFPVFQHGFDLVKIFKENFFDLDPPGFFETASIINRN